MMRIRWISVVKCARETSNIARTVPGGEAAANEEVTHEVAVHRRIGAHPNIVRCLGIFCYSQSQQCLVLEYCQHGLLSDWLTRQQSSGMASELNRRSIVQQTCSAMEVVSRAGLVHRDLAAHNVLVFSEEPICVKITDFGMAVDDTSRSGRYVRPSVLAVMGLGFRV